MAFGILAGLLAIYGRFKWDRVRYVFMPKSWWGNRNARYGAREYLSWNAFIPHAQKAATRSGDSVDGAINCVADVVMVGTSLSEHGDRA